MLDMARDIYDERTKDRDVLGRFDLVRPLEDSKCDAILGLTKPRSKWGKRSSDWLSAVILVLEKAARYREEIGWPRRLGGTRST